MNERIKELESQCWEARQYGPPWFNSQQFAELIVRECADRVSKMVMRDKFDIIPQDPHSRGWNDAVEYASKELKKSLGVEE
jgi:hypothetical protein